MQDTYTVRDLMTRYSCAASTIYRYMNTKGYPRGGSGLGSRKKIAGEEVYAWELKHMPWLHPSVNTDRDEREAEEAMWKGIKADHEARLAAGPAKAREPVPKKGWEDVRRDVKKIVVHKGVIMKPRHGKKPVARTGA